MAPWRAGVEHGRASVREQLLGHEVVGVECFGEVRPVDADCHAHEHLLRTFDCQSLHVLQKLAFFKSFDCKEVLKQVSFVLNLFLDYFMILSYNVL